MKNYLVKLNRPLLINIGDKKENIYLTAYGFLAPYCDANEAKNNKTEDDIYVYCAYLAAMHVWTSGTAEFSVIDDKEWMDKDGIVHYTYSPWALDIGERYKKALGLDYTLSIIDLDDMNADCHNCGIKNSLIICKCCMEHLERIAQMQTTAQYNVLLFNRPIWLPKSELWNGEEGHSHIYGFISDNDLDRDNLNDCGIYLGYLALCEEVYLNGISPSGYTSNPGLDIIWHNNGRQYSRHSKEIEAECRLCKNKHNLKLHGATVKVSQADIMDGVRDGFILSQELYQSLLDQITDRDTVFGCPK